MPEDTHVIRGIHWRETFPFTHVFRSFRVAIHPSKLILALLAILLLYIGGRTLDGIWPASHMAVDNEIDLYERARVANSMAAANPAMNHLSRAERAEMATGLDFHKQRDDARLAAQDAYAAALVSHRVSLHDGKTITPEEAKDAAADGQHLNLFRDRLIEERDRAVERLEKRHDLEYQAVKDGTLPTVRPAISQYFDTLDNAKDQKTKDDAKAALDKTMADARSAQETREKNLNAEQKGLDEHRKQSDREAERAAYQHNRAEAYSTTEVEYARADRIHGRGLWSVFMDYEVNRVNDVVAGVMNNNWFGGLTDAGHPGVFGSAYRFFCIAPRWAAGEHTLYFLIFGLLFLIVWAIFGGAISRIAAVHVARDEKLSMRQALRFSSGKFLSFVFAPLIPVVIVLAVGLVIAVGGLLLYIPFVGEILVGVFFFLALAGGFVMTLVALGTAGGLNLMYPTIAAEGSDSFDAISRSFSYVYARPWRMLWYTVVAIIYGAFTFLFVRLFIYLTLGFAHKFTGLWVARSTGGEQSMWNAIWPGPSLFHLPYELNSISLSFGQKVAAFFVALWVFLAISFLGAYLISYYFSSSAIIYALMRREVDATELDDVYLEQSEDEFAEPAPVTSTPVTSTPVASTPVVTTPIITAPIVAPPVAIVTPPPTDGGTPPPAGG
jgi:hypothetical protein